MLLTDFSVLIVEDDALTAETIREYLSELQLSSCFMAHHKNDAFTLLKSKHFDLIILDIRMQGLYDGIEIGTHLSQLGTPFIYLTAHSDKELAEKMMQTKAKAYISKPIRKNEFLLNMRFVLNDLLQHTQATIMISNGLERIQLNKKEIISMKSMGNYLELVLKDRSKLVIRNTMEKVLNELSDRDFIQTHRSYVINRKAIEKVSASNLIMTDQQVIPISRSYRVAIKELLA